MPVSVGCIPESEWDMNGGRQVEEPNGKLGASSSVELIV